MGMLPGGVGSSGPVALRQRIAGQLKENPEQVRQLLEQFAQIVIEEVPVSKYRTRIIARLDAMAIGLGQPIPKKGDSDDK